MLGKSEATSLAICIFFLMPFTGFYVSLGGLWGVLWTDLFQFVLKMAIVIAVAYYGVRGAGGMHAMLAKLAAMREVAGPGASRITAMFPDFSQRAYGRSLVDAASAHISRASGSAMVGVLVSGSGAGRRRIHRAADFQRAR